MALTYVCTSTIFYKFVTHELKHLVAILSTKSLWTNVYVDEYTFSIESVTLVCADEQSSSVNKPEVSYYGYDVVLHKLMMLKAINLMPHWQHIGKITISFSTFVKNEDIS